MSTTLRTNAYDAHLFPLYLKFSADRFRCDNTPEGLQFFGLVCDTPRELEHKVYKQMWKVKGRIAGNDEFGRKAFHNQDGLSSSSLEKAQAIDRVLRKTDQDELIRRENHVYRHLWRINSPYRNTSDLEYGRHAFNNTHGQYSSMLDNVTVLREYAMESRILTWLSWAGNGGKDVHLIKTGNNELECLVIDRSAENSWSMPFNPGGAPIEEAISFLKRCDVAVNGNDLAISESRSPTYLQETLNLTLESKELRLLLKDNNNLVWRVFDKNSKTVSLCYAFDDSIDAMKHKAFTERTEGRSCLNDFRIRIAVTNDNRLMNVFIDKKWTTSRLDPRKVIDCSRWAITLIDAGRSESDPGSWGGHAMIAYEGVEDGKAFLRYSDLANGIEGIDYPTVRILDTKNHKERLFSVKSETWVRKRHWVKLMENKIKTEEGKPMPFSLTNEHYTLSGFKKLKNYLFSGKHQKADDNCLTWTVRKL
jgi:hypothetical protein